MGAVKLMFLVQRPPYKSENPRLALTHAISSQTAEIYMDEGDSVVPTVVLVGDGVLNAVKNQQAMKSYGVTSTEGHIKNSLLIDVPIWVCKEDMQRLGLKEDQMITDAEELGGELKTKFVSFAEIQKEMESVQHLLFF
ncbi:MAG TPA: DsrE family protein [Nitrospirota bacterium]|nr:DsrE family protein [Nitrospirota bacterium]